MSLLSTIRVLGETKRFLCQCSRILNIRVSILRNKEEKQSLSKVMSLTYQRYTVLDE
jgi:hypothetical protein